MSNEGATERKHEHFFIAQKNLITKDSTQIASQATLIIKSLLFCAVFN